MDSIVFLWFPLVSFDFLWFGAGWTLWLYFDFLWFPSGSFGFLQFLLISFVFLWFGAGWILWFSFGVLCFPLVLFGFQGRNKGKENPRKRQTNQGKFKEAISSQNASIMPVTKEAARFSVSCYVFGFLYLERQDARDLAIVL